MICGNTKLLNLFTTLFTIEIHIRFTIIFLNPRNIQIVLHNNLLTIRISSFPVTQGLREGGDNDPGAHGF